MKPQQTVDWGITHYADALERQKQLVQDRIDGTQPDTLVFTEHPPTYTLGKRIGSAQNLLWDQEQLADKGIDVFETNRGGDITYHGPGQIVGYSIIDLSSTKDLHAFLRTLEEVLIQTVSHWGIEATRNPGKTGIWVGPNKIAAIGIAIRRWTSYHGFALNLNPDLSHFQGIIPCGITAQEGGVGSICQELESPLEAASVKAVLQKTFWEHF